MWTSEQSSNGSSSLFRFIPAPFGRAEDAEEYRLGRLHPVHLGDRYDNGRYRVVHKLGAGGYSTVWLALDETDHRWVALKIVVAEYSASIEAKSLLSRQAASRYGSETAFAVQYRNFTIDGPNGRHLCLVLPVLGPSMSQSSEELTSRITPWLAREASYQAIKALVDLHAEGLCHGDLTTANIVFTLSNFDQFTEADIYTIFGTPEIEPLETESGEPLGPEAPRYIVNVLDFLSSKENIISKDVRIIDFDQSFPTASPPKRMLGTPPEFLAPEVAVGLEPSPASDVWALGCSIFRLRSGKTPFSGYSVTSPADLLQAIVQSIGDMPSAWESTLFNYYGQPTDDPTKGVRLEKLHERPPLRDTVYSTWDQPKGAIAMTGKTRPEHSEWDPETNKPFPPCFSDFVWNPKATKIDNVYLHGYDEETDELLEAMPKIPKQEAALLYDLLSKIFVYDPRKRITAAEMLRHPWFQMTPTEDCDGE